jgi:hypothetical protein
MSNVYHLPPQSSKRLRTAGKSNGLQEEILRRAELRANLPASPWSELTGALIMEKHRRGTLDPGIVEAFLAAVNIPVPR